MKLSDRRSLQIGVLYFLILLCIAMWVRDVANQPDAMATLQKLTEVSEMSDPTYFSKAAVDVAENGWISPANEWIFNLWPPGFILLEALIMKVGGPDAPVILILQILAAGLFAVVLTLFKVTLQTKLPARVAFFIPLSIFLFPVCRLFLLQPTAVALGETFAIGFFALFIFLALLSVVRESAFDAVLAGTFLGLSAYFRSQFELLLLVLTVWGVLLAILVRLNMFPKLLDRRLFSPSVKTILVALFAAHLLTIPWRIYHWIYQGKPYWVATASAMFQNAVVTSEQLIKVGAGWIVHGGGNLVCRIDISACGDSINANKLFVKTFLSNPVEWFSLKIPLIGEYWFSSLQDWTSVVNHASPAELAIDLLLLSAVLASTAMLVTRKTRLGSLWLLLAWVTASLLSAYGVIFTLAHLETRYFYFPKIMGLLMVLTILGLQYRGEKK